MKRLTSKLSVITVAFLLVFAFACGGDDKEAETPTDTTATEDGTGDVAVTPDDVAETPDDAVETPDDAVETPDDAVETPDDAVETPDDAVETPDDAVETPDDAVEAAGACMNADDGALIQADQEGISDAAKNCGLECMADEDAGACATACVVDSTGLSEGCSGCYVGMILCSITNCLVECAADPGSDACATCQVENDCYTDFYACSGLTPSEE